MNESITRRNLPHWYVPGAMHFVTFRLAGTLPRTLIDDLSRRKEQWMRRETPAGLTRGEYRERIHKQLFAVYDKYLDQQSGDVCWLADPRIAAVVRTSLHHLNGTKYDLLSYCIMPNHVHVLFLPREVMAIRPEELEMLEPGESADKTSPLSRIMHSLKSFIAHEANRVLKRTGQFWQHESYDHWVRDEDELERIVAYINANPVWPQHRMTTTGARPTTAI